MQNQSTQNIVHGGGFVAPPPLPDAYQPPPPPPPVQSMQPSEMPVQPVMYSQTHNLQQPPPKVQVAPEQPSDSSPRMNEPQSTHINPTQPSASMLSQDRNFNVDQSHSQHNQDGFRRNIRSSRWGNNDNSDNNSDNSNRNNRMFGGHTNFSNRNSTSHDDHASNDHDDDDEEKEEKSQEEIAFDISFQKWEDQLASWKRNNANHPDRNQYNDFITKMEGCRKQLLQRRENLRQKRLDRIRSAQLVQNSPNNPSPQATNKNEISAEGLDQENFGQTRTTTNNFEPEEPIAPGLFSSDRCDGNAAIPGLDLVSGDDRPSRSGGGGSVGGDGPPPSCSAPAKCESAKPETDSNIVARVTNILGNPQIQSLLSNIQKQKSETAMLQSNVQARGLNAIAIDGQSGVNVFNRPPDNLGHIDKQQNTDEPQTNPFRHNTHCDADLGAPNFSEHDMNSKRGRYDVENTVNDRPEFDRFDRFDRFNRFDRDRNDPFTQVNSTILPLPN